MAETIARGELGSMQTLAKMRALVNQAITDPIVIERARRIVRECPPRNYDCYAQHIRAYLQEHLQFVQDPHGVETLATVRALLAGIDRAYVVQGDCDEAAILGCALAKAVGLRCRFVVLGFHHPSAPYSHVYGIASGSTRWWDLDTTRPVRLLVEPPITRSHFIEV